MEINKVADLIPYRNSLEALWDREDFQPVKALWACLYKEAMDTLLTSRQTGLREEQFKTAEVAAEARVFNQMYNLPSVLKQMEDHIKQVEAARMKSMWSQERGGLQGTSTEYNGGEKQAPESTSASKFLVDTLKERFERLERLRKEEQNAV